VSPLEKSRADSATTAERSNIPRWHFVCPLVFLSVASSVWAVDPSRHISQYAHTAWRIQDGVFSGTPNAISQATDGYVWIGMEAGLVRFDGVRFVPRTPPDGKHLPSSNITSLLGARDGSLWIGMEGGLSHWDNRDLTTITRPVIHSLGPKVPNTCNESLKPPRITRLFTPKNLVGAARNESKPIL
jgi:ligand-binding sensor domain-containing protein